MGRRGSKIDDNGMKWHHFLVKKLMVTSFLVKNITFDQFLNIFEKSQKIEKNQIFKIVKYFICPGQKIQISILLIVCDCFCYTFAYMEVWR